jgi:ribose transport system permease protein
MLGIINMGMLLVILSGGIDLGVGSVLALSSVTVAKFQWFMPWSVAILLVLGIGLLLGFINGTFITMANVAPFVMTLSMMTIARGLAFFYSKGAAVLLPYSGFSYIGAGYLGPFPIPVIAMIVVFALTGWTLKQTSFGSIVIAIGGNEEAVRLSGIMSQKYKTFIYMISGFCSALAGIILTSWMGVGFPDIR